MSQTHRHVSMLSGFTDVWFKTLRWVAHDSHILFSIIKYFLLPHITFYLMMWLGGGQRETNRCANRKYVLQKNLFNIEACLPATLNQIIQESKMILLLLHENTTLFYSHAVNTTCRSDYQQGAASRNCRSAHRKQQASCSPLNEWQHQTNTVMMATGWKMKAPN